MAAENPKDWVVQMEIAWQKATLHKNQLSDSATSKLNNLAKQILMVIDNDVKNLRDTAIDQNKNVCQKTLPSILSHNKNHINDTQHCVVC